MAAPRIRVQRRPVHGVLLLDKPLHLSSNDALQRAKWLLRAEKAGHTGTLDPLATGVLPLCFGAATKFSHIHLDAVKTYEATLKLGIKTRTGDAEGTVIETQAVGSAISGQSQLDAARQRWTGKILQVPPMTSALKKDGKPLYELARQGIEVTRPSREVEIHKLTITRVADDVITLVVTCSKGTYIRTLGEDIAATLGTVGHLIALRRTATADFGVAQTITLAQLEATPDEDRVQLLQPVDTMLSSYTRVDLDNENAGRFLSGVRRRTTLADCALVKVYGPADQLLGSAHIKTQELIPTRLLSPLDIAQMQI